MLGFAVVVTVDPTPTGAIGKLCVALSESYTRPLCRLSLQLTGPVSRSRALVRRIHFHLVPCVEHCQDRDTCC